MPGAHSDVGLDRLRQRKGNRRSVPGRSKQRFILGVADVTRLEQHGGGRGPAEDMEGSEAVRLGPKLEAAR